MLAVLLHACIFKVLSLPLWFAAALTGGHLWAVGEKALPTSGLQLSLDMLRGGQWRGEAEGLIGLHAGF